MTGASYQHGTTYTQVTYDFLDPRAGAPSAMTGIVHSFAKGEGEFRPGAPGQPDLLRIGQRVITVQPTWFERSVETGVWNLGTKAFDPLPPEAPKAPLRLVPFPTGPLPTAGPDGHP